MVDTNVVRTLVLYGPPLAGKSEALRSIANRAGASIETFQVVTSTDGIWNRGLRAHLSPDFVVETVAGAVWQGETSWQRLLERSARLVVVMDLQETRVDISIEFLMRVLDGLDPSQRSSNGAVPLHVGVADFAVLVTKLDLGFSAENMGRVTSLLETRGLQPQLFVCSSLTREGVKPFVEWALAF